MSKRKNHGHANHKRDALKSGKKGKPKRATKTSWPDCGSSSSRCRSGFGTRTYIGPCVRGPERGGQGRGPSSGLPRVWTPGPAGSCRWQSGPIGGTHTEWYFQRHVQLLPCAGEMVIFDRSWYNRAPADLVNTGSPYPMTSRSAASSSASTIPPGAGNSATWIWRGARSTRGPRTTCRPHRQAGALVRRRCRRQGRARL